MDLLDKAFNYGVPSAILFTFIVALWYIGRWLRDNVVMPMVKAHLTLVATMQAELPRLNQQLDSLTGLTSRQNALLEKNATAVMGYASAADVSAKEIVAAVKLCCYYPRPNRD